MPPLVYLKEIARDALTYIGLHMPSKQVSGLLVHGCRLALCLRQSQWHAAALLLSVLGLGLGDILTRQLDRISGDLEWH